MLSEPLWVIVPAAGQGTRAGLDIPKQFQVLGDKTVLEWTITRLLRLNEVSGVVVAVPRGELSDTNGMPNHALLRMSGPGRPVVLVPGGSTRQESVYSGLAAVPCEVRWIAVHDAARPCFSRDLLCRVWAAARSCGAAICALKPTDTVKAVSRVGPVGLTGLAESSGAMSSCGPGGTACWDGATAWVDSTLNRDSLVSVQTPQVFEAGLLRKAHQAARDSGLSGTDDSQLVEALGHHVAIVPGERGNLKITYPEDFDIALRRLASGGSGGSGRQFPRRRLSRRWSIRGAEPSPNRNSEAPATVTGLGFDIHPLVPGRKCVLGGVVIPSDRGPLGHSDGDVLCHAVMDAVLGALGEGDIGLWFPPGDPRYEGASSIGLMQGMWERLMSDATVVHIDATVIAEVPKIAPFYGTMRAAIGSALGIRPEQVSIKATTAERLGAIGREEGIAAFAVATVSKTTGE